MSALSRQIDLFQDQLIDIRARHGSAWTVFLDGQVLGAFSTFDEAADFAFNRVPEDDFLIRHTYQEPETVPFMVV